MITPIQKGIEYTVSVKLKNGSVKPPNIAIPASFKTLLYLFDDSSPMWSAPDPPFGIMLDYGPNEEKVLTATFTLPANAWTGTGKFHVEVRNIRSELTVKDEPVEIQEKNSYLPLLTVEGSSPP